MILTALAYWFFLGGIGTAVLLCIRTMHKRWEREHRDQYDLALAPYRTSIQVEFRREGR